MAEYSNSIFTLTGRRQLKKVFKNNMYPNGYKIKFFIIGTGGTDSNRIPKLVKNNTERLECEGTIMTNTNVTFTPNSSQAVVTSGNLPSVNDYIRPNFGYDDLISKGEILWFRITSIEGSNYPYTLNLDTTYPYTLQYSGVICRIKPNEYNDLYPYGFVKIIQDADIDVNVPGDDYCAKVRIFLDNGEGNGHIYDPQNPPPGEDYSECGLYDIENKLIAYANFPRFTKSNAGQLTRYFNLRV
jgi:hypothetical protein